MLRSCCNGLWGAVGVMALLVSGTSLAAANEKIKLEELIARHLNSIGTAEARAAAKSRSMQGEASAAFRVGGLGELHGQGGIVSEGHKACIRMNFAHPEYPGEHIAFDGKDVTVGILKPGIRSSLSKYFYEQNTTIKEGLLGGVIRTDWFLNNIGSENLKLSYKGLKKIDGKELHMLECKIKGENLLKIDLYFEPDSFRHVLSKHELREPPQLAYTYRSDSNVERDTVYTITERFDNFQQVDGLTLPHTYKISISIDSAIGTSDVEYIIKGFNMVHNTPVDPSVFRVQGVRGPHHPPLHLRPEPGVHPPDDRRGPVAAPR
jgi:hypothetical protein